LWYCSSFSGTTLPSASTKLWREKLVRIMPGAIALTRMPWRPTSVASVFVSIATAAFVIA
jgi:hypothetical protein